MRLVILGFTFSVPNSEDAAAVHQLISDCPPLDTNSLYCNLLQCEHFASSSVVAKKGDRVVGFISGYYIPARPNTLFVWQVAVGQSARGQGLAKKMLLEILARERATQVNHLETTITADNSASWALFESLARDLDAELRHATQFDKVVHLADRHDTEILARIGPFTPAQIVRNHQRIQPTKVSAVQ